ncbi:hypothetical protein HMPREF9374_2010 [Desmospora sp. 8437]|nr:hypothetical protein HMPREF9374_2010 [Desmospora sp. 8437]
MKNFRDSTGFVQQIHFPVPSMGLVIFLCFYSQIAPGFCRITMVNGDEPGNAEL